MRLTVRMVGLAVFALTAVGAGPLVADAARAYVVRKPDGAYAPLAVRLMVELDAHRRQSDGWRGLDERQAMVGTLIFRPRALARVIKIYGDFGSGRGSEGADLRRSLAFPPPTEVETARSALESLEILRKRLQRDTTRCDRIRRREAYLGCIADVMDQFAAGLETLPAMTGSVTPVAVPAVRDAALAIRRGGSVSAARSAIAVAIGEVRKSIDLVQAGGDDLLRRLELGQRSIVIDALSTVDTSLVQASGL
jgi:hypothetical protein